MTRRRVVLAAAIAVSLVLGLDGAVVAGGPTFFKAPGVPAVWPDGGRNIRYLTDQGTLGPMTNAEAVAQTVAAFQRWADVLTATVSFQNLGSLPFDVDETSAFDVIFGEPDGTIRVVYDADGAIFELLGGALTQRAALGVTFLNADLESGDLIGSVVVLNGAAITSGSLTPEQFEGVVVHEIGHAIGLGHSIVNALIFFGDHTGPTPHDTFPRPASPVGKIETMSPVLAGVGEQVLHADDIAAISALYPEPGFLSGTGTITGRILTVRGEPLLLPVTVIARNLDDPFDDAVSAVVGGGGQELFFPHDPSVDGVYTLRGLKPGARYAIYVDNHDSEGFTLALPGPEEFYNGAQESADPAIDDPSVFTPLIVAAGTTLRNIDIRLNRFAPGRLFLLDLQIVELFPPFPIRMCGQTFDSLQLSAGGHIELGRPSSSFYTESLDFLGGRSPVIAGLSTSLVQGPGSAIVFEQTSQTFAVSFTDVLTLDTRPPGRNTFSMTLHATEGEKPTRVTLSYGRVEARRAVAGYSCGGRFTSGFETATDLSRLAGREIDGTGKTAIFEVFTDGVDLAGKTLTFHLPGPFRDDFEPNDSPARARRVKLPFTTADRFTQVRPGDVDFYRFAAAAGEIVVAERFSPNRLANLLPDSLPRVLLGLFEGGPGGRLLATSSPATYPLARLIFTIPADGEYVLAVTTAPDGRFTGIGEDHGRYQLALNTYRGRALALGFRGTVELPLAFSFPFQLAEWRSVWVNAEGNLTFGEGDRFGRRGFLGGPPRIAPFFAGLDPSGASTGRRVTGLVLADEGPDSLTIHWVSVPLFFDTTETASFSVTLDRRGDVRMTWGGVSQAAGGVSEASPTPVVGITQGRGALAEPTDLSRQKNHPVEGTTFEQFPRDCFPDVADLCVTPFDLSFRELRFVKQGTVARVPLDVTGSGTTGALSYEVLFGYSGPFSVRSSGLFAASEQVATVPDDPENDINVALSTGVGVTAHPVVIPPGTSHARFALVDAETDGQHDLDLYLFGSDGAFITGSFGLTADEEVRLDSPAPGTYTVVVHGFETEGPTATYTLFTWLLGAGHVDNLSLAAPHVAHDGRTGQVTASWRGLAPDRRYLGAIIHCRGQCRSPDDFAGQTFIRVDP